MITRHQFEAADAEVRGWSLEEQRHWRVIIPAERDGSGECDYEGCEGWHSILRSIIESDIKWGFRPESDRDLLDPENTLQEGARV